VRGNDVAWAGLTRPQLFLLVTVPLVAARIVWQAKHGAYRDAMRHSTNPSGVGQGTS